MALAKFQFGAQPALDRAHASRRSIEKDLRASLSELQEAQSSLDAQVSLRATLEKQVATLRHDLASGRIGAVSTEDLAATLRLIAGLRSRIDLTDQAIRDRRAALRIIEQRVASQRRDLSRAVSAAESLERFKANLAREHNIRVQRGQEQALEDDAAQHWNFRNAPGD